MTAAVDTPPVSPIARLALAVIGLYRTMVSPFRPPACRFLPTCSQYAVEAITGYGILRGGWLAVTRLLRCGPWHSGGWDPVPDRCDGHTAAHQQPRSVDV